MAPSGEQTRHDVLHLLEQAAKPLHPHEIAYLLHVHVNTVRRHLDILEGAGLVHRLEEHRDEPGRPRVLYEVHEPGDNSTCGSHRMLARILAGFIAATHDDPSAAGLQAGRALGEHLVEAEPFSRTDVAAAMERTFAMLASLGFSSSEQTATGRSSVTVTLGKCPFRDLARDYPDVICHLHLGLIVGAQQRLGSGLTVADFHPGGPDAQCHVQLVQGGTTAPARVRFVAPA